MSVKVATIVSSVLLLFVILYFGCKEYDASEYPVSSSVPSKEVTVVAEPIETVVEELQVPKYKILREHTNYSDYDILMSSIDLNTVKYKKDVEAIISDVARKSGRKRFVAWVFDNAKAANLNYKDLETAESLSGSETTFVNEHVVAVYSSGFAGEGHYYISYFENVPSDRRERHVAWREAYNENDIDKGFTPH